MEEALEALLTMYRQTKKIEAKADESLFNSFNTPHVRGINSSTDETKKQETAYKNLNKKDFLTQASEKFTKLNVYMEGNKNYFYNPGKGTSGWTTGQGIDIAHTTRAEAIELGMPQVLVKQADKAKAWGKPGMKVPAAVKAIKANTDTPEWEQFTLNTNKKSEPFMAKMKEMNPALSVNSIATLAQAHHWAGDIFATPDKASKFNRSQISLETDGKRTSKTANLVNPLKLLLESGNATDEGLQEVMSLVKTSYGNGRPLNSTTMGKYGAFLKDGSMK